MSILCSVGRASVTKYELDEYDSVAHENSTIVAGNARFTILTSRLIRMEYAENGRFEDRPSIAVLHRATPTPKFDVSRSNGDGVSIKTEHVQIARGAVPSDRIGEGSPYGQKCPRPRVRQNHSPWFD